MSIKIGRNDPCPCGSGKKYKKCCLNKKGAGIYNYSGSGSESGAGNGLRVSSVQASSIHASSANALNAHDTQPVYEDEDGSFIRELSNFDLHIILNMAGLRSREELSQAYNEYRDYVETITAQPGLITEDLPSFIEYLRLGRDETRSLLTSFRRELRIRRISTQEELNSFYEEFAVEHNLKPTIKNTNLGLSQAQMKQIIESDFSEIHGIVKLSDDLNDNDVIEAPFIKRLLILTDLFRKNNSRLEITQAGNLRPKYINEIKKHFSSPNPFGSFGSFFGGNSNQESSSPEISILKNFLIDRNYVKKMKTILRLDEKKWSPSEEGFLAGVYRELLFYCLDSYDWISSIRNPTTNTDKLRFIQKTAAVSLLMLKQLPAYFISPSELYRNFCLIFPRFDQHLKPTDDNTTDQRKTKEPAPHPTHASKAATTLSSKLNYTLDFGIDLNNTAEADAEVNADLDPAAIDDPFALFDNADDQSSHPDNSEEQIPNEQESSKGNYAYRDIFIEFFAFNAGLLEQQNEVALEEIMKESELNTYPTPVDSEPESYKQINTTPTPKSEARSSPQSKKYSPTAEETDEEDDSIRRMLNLLSSITPKEYRVTPLFHRLFR